MAKNNNLGDLLTSIANAIRTKKGTSDAINAQDFDTEIANLPSGGGDFVVDIRSSATDVELTESDTQKLSILATKANGINYLFNSCTKLTRANMSSFTSIASSSLLSTFSGCTGLKYVDLSSVKSVATNGMRSTFQGCSNLEEIKLDSLEYNGTLAVYYYCFYQCGKLKKVSINPVSLQSSNMSNGSNPLCQVTNLTDLTFTKDTTENVYLNNCTKLTSTSVLNVLNHLSTSASGKTCVFNVTIASTDVNYSQISAKVESLTNWTISGLTL